jgi:homoserine dehydrogenase
MHTNLKLGIFGFGVVGQGLYHVLEETKGIKAEILRICVKDERKARPLPKNYFTYQKDDILENDEVDVVIELINDPEAAFDIVSTALQKGKAVVTANKKMVADNFQTLYDLQQKFGAPLLYEGACCASIPIIRNLEEYYDNDLLNAVEGIFNGSTNYILTKVFEQGQSFAEALREAQKLGYAEKDPSLDVQGYDPKYKLCLILAHAFGIFPSPGDVFNYGIQNLSDFDIEIARQKGFKIKLMAKSRKSGNRVFAFVMPQFVTVDSDLYKVGNEFNGVIVEGAFSEHQFFIGKGAGGHPTGSAVLSDISALTYKYKYEYKKKSQGLGYQLSDDFEIQVYLRYKKNAEIDMSNFIEISEEHRTNDDCYIIGRIGFSKLTGSDWLHREDINIILTAEQPKEPESL